MIIRILTEGQYEVPQATLAQLNTLDDHLQRAVDARDPQSFRAALRELLAAVRAAGSPVPDTTLTTSDLVLPAPDATLDDVIALLGADGLIPG